MQTVNVHACFLLIKDFMTTNVILMQILVIPLIYLTVRAVDVSLFRAAHKVTVLFLHWCLTSHTQQQGRLAHFTFF